MFAMYHAQRITQNAHTAALRVVEDYCKSCALVENLRDAIYDPSDELLTSCKKTPARKQPVTSRILHERIRRVGGSSIFISFPFLKVRRCPHE